MGFLRGTFLDPTDDTQPSKGQLAEAEANRHKQLMLGGGGGVLGDGKGSNPISSTMPNGNVNITSGGPAVTSNSAEGNTMNTQGMTPEQQKAILDAQAAQAAKDALTKGDPNYQKWANDRSGEAINRAAFQMNAVQLGPAVSGTAAKIGANERAANSQIGPFQNAQAAQSGAADQMGYANINRQDLEGRNGQAALIGQLQDQANGNGPSLATSQLRDAQDRNRKQVMGMASSLGGNGNSAMALRMANNNIAAGNQQVAHDAAQARIQEQLNARTMLGNQLGTMRSQDIGVNTNQAGLQQQSMGANMAANNQFTLSDTANRQNANMYNAQGFNAQQAQQAGMNLQNSQFNAGQTNSYNLNQAQLDQQMGLTNLANTNNFTIQQANLNESAAENNLNANINNRAQNDATGLNYLQMGANLNQADVNRNLTLAQAQANFSLGKESNMNQSSQFQQQMQQANINRAVGLAGGGLSAAAQAYAAETKSPVGAGGGGTYTPTLGGGQGATYQAQPELGPGAVATEDIFI